MSIKRSQADRSQKLYQDFIREKDLWVLSATTERGGTGSSIGMSS